MSDRDEARLLAEERAERERDHEDGIPCQLYPYDCERCVADHGQVPDEFDRADQLYDLRNEK